MPQPFVIAVTGGIATGKSTVCQTLLAALPSEEVRFFDADACVHGLLTNPPIVSKIASSLGPDVLSGDGTLDRARVSAKVFQSPDLRASLEAILHPHVRQTCSDMLAQARSSRVRLFLADIPLFYETQFPLETQAQLLVACGPLTQRQRLLARSPDRSPHQLDQRLAAQLPILQKIPLASHVLWNGGSREALASQISTFLSWLKTTLTPISTPTSP